MSACLYGTQSKTDLPNNVFDAASRRALVRSSFSFILFMIRSIRCIIDVMGDFSVNFGVDCSKRMGSKAGRGVSQPSPFRFLAPADPEFEFS